MNGNHKNIFAYSMAPESLTIRFMCQVHWQLGFLREVFAGLMAHRQYAVLPAVRWAGRYIYCSCSFEWGHCRMVHLLEYRGQRLLWLSNEAVQNYESGWSAFLLWSQLKSFNISKIIFPRLLSDDVIDIVRRNICLLFPE